MRRNAPKTPKARGRKATAKATIKKTKVPEVEPVCNRGRRVVKRKATEEEWTSSSESSCFSSAGSASCSTVVKEVAVRKRKAVVDVEVGRKKRRMAMEGIELKAPERVMDVRRKTVAETSDTSRGKKRRAALMNTEEEVPRWVSFIDVGGSERRQNGTVGAKKKRQKDTKQEVPMSVTDLRAEFKAKYQQDNKMGEGAFGCVFAGYRKEDRMPVAIKHVPKKDIMYDHQGDARRTIPIEVAVMLKLQEYPCNSEGASAPVALLDWYQLGRELIMVHERPVPCQDMQHHLRGRGGSISEAEAKIIFYQLVEAAFDLQNKQVFHRDIHQANVLIDTSSAIPRVRIIDFGVSCFANPEDSFHMYLGNSNHAAPECRQQYHAGPFTVWQIGMLLYESLHNNAICWTEKFLDGTLKIKKTLSPRCKDFLRLCLTKDPKKRPSLARLRVHPWLR